MFKNFAAKLKFCSPFLFAGNWHLAVDMIATLLFLCPPNFLSQDASGN